MTSQKWVNVSAGPRQFKELVKAVSALQWEGTNHTELYGVIGGQMAEAAGSLERLPDSAFKASGTDISTVLAVIPAPVPAAREAA